jgi:hypothetical protein
MFFNLCFPAIDPWTDLDELLAPPEQVDAGCEPTSSVSASSVSSRPPARRDGEGVDAGTRLAPTPLAAAAGR